LVAIGGPLGSGPSSTTASAATQHSNGVADATPSTIIADARAAIEAASTVHVSGAMINSGARVSVDMEMVKGKGGYGTFTATRAGQPATYRLIILGTTLYLEGDRSFWELEGTSSTDATVLQGRWVKESAEHGDNAVLASILTARTFFAGALALHGPLTKLSTTTALGAPVVPVTNAKRTGIIYVATTGEPYPVEITVPGTKGGTLDVDRIDQSASLIAPANAITVPAG
jgi:hypothetical protein